MTNKGHALAREELVRALTAYTGIATADGAPDGSTIIDANLDGRNDFITEKTIIIMSGPAAYEDKGAQSFVSAHPATITLQGTGFSAQITAGTIYRILNISSVEIDVANIKTVVDAIKTLTDKIATKMLFSMDFWCDPAEEVQLAAVAGTKTLPPVTIADLPTGATIVRAIAMFKFRMVENTNAAANNLSGGTVANTSQVIQVADDTPGTYYDAINFVDNQFGLAATTREGGDVLIGSIDISGAGKVDGNDGYLFRWLLAKADLDNLNFNDVACGIRIYYSL
ncbi:hypothetical protein ES707_19536 [subsurface metagenome]